VLRSAFKYLFDMEQEILEIGDKMGSCTEEELYKLMDDMGTLQDILDNSGFYNIDSKVEEVARGLGLRDVGLDKQVDELSGGQRSKVLLGKLLLESPDILLLDEPTNHLDQDAKDELKKTLKEYKGTILLVSHEKEFYEDIATHIWNCEEWTRKIF